ncbi:acetyl-CoA hydrolase/transferase C-terminal domain-containing protein [Mycobacterium sp.]|uniref:acetyl-CoA hydrolase/transferase C-terminal domain-containing protein n=1 Tax=Mycobacterium sp. TaxID=1785 RepID=UPI00120F2C06|nr:acetyl-CoA hydrolase/transferase C-terminal domain-containing protein [Mycobacterium sp.]TAM65116.1 MAG: acetyl-CoA hydrolase [Mycobacterium sp.]
MSVTSGFGSTLRAALRPGSTVALGDGVGTLRSLDDGTDVCSALSDAAREIGSIRLVLGWSPTPLPGLEVDAFTEVIALMPGWGVRAVLAGGARYVPTSLAAISPLLNGPLRPDLLVTRLVERDGALHFGTEVSWQAELADSGVPVLAVLDDTGPSASACPPVRSHSVRIAAHTDDGPAQLATKEPEPLHDALAEQVLRLVPPGARLQYGPGQLGTALLRNVQVPLQIDTGLLTDAVVDLDCHGLLAGCPSATYLMGTDRLYEWADTRPILRGIDYTHDISRLSGGDPFIAVNTALEIDPFGQINVEGSGEKVVGGIGGHPDYCAAGRLSRQGLSIIAVPSRLDGRTPLVAKLSRPASTPAHNVDVVVTEDGYADLRRADWTERTKLICSLFEKGEGQ